MGQPDSTRNLIDPNLFLTRLKWPFLTCNPIDLTQPACFAMSNNRQEMAHLIPLFVVYVYLNKKLFILQKIKRKNLIGIYTYPKIKCKSYISPRVMI